MYTDLIIVYGLPNNVINIWIYRHLFNGNAYAQVRGVAKNSGLGGPGSNQDLFCFVGTNLL